MKMKKGRPGPVGKEKNAPIHAPIIMQKVISDMRKQKKSKGIAGVRSPMPTGYGY